MQDEPQYTGAQEYKYWGFISYSHADEKWADWLHKSLETYLVPKQLVGKPTKYGPIPKKPFPIFRDRDELPSSADLGDKLTAALRGSRYLLVICSPRSVASEWVNEEIKTFKSFGRESQVLCLIVDGEPYASNNPQLGLEECFPEPIRYQVDERRQITDIRTEPIAADARKGKDGKANARLKLLSGMFNVNFSDLKQRDHERAQRRLKMILAGVMALFVVFMVLGVKLYFEKKRADEAREFAEAETGRAEKALTSAREARDEAERNFAEAKEQRDRAVKAEGEARTAQQEAEKNFQEAKEQRDRAVKAEGEARTAQQEAEKNFQEAKEQRDRAVRAEGEARVAQKDAEDNFKEANVQRLRAVSALSISDFNAAARLIDDGSQATAIAYLSRSLSVNPENSSTEARLISLLSGENWSLPRTAPLLHAGPVVDVAYSPDGGRFVTVSRNEAQIWDVETGEKVGEPLMHRNAIYLVRYNRAGNRIVTASDPEAQVWDAATGKAVGPALKHEGRIESVEFNRDGSRVATCSSDRTAKVWETETGKEIASVSVNGRPAGADISPDGRYIVVAFDTTAQMYDASSGAPWGAPATGHEGGIFGIDFGPNGKYFATASGDKTARVWNAETGAPATEPLAHEGRVVHVTFNPSGLQVVTSCEDSAARIWSVATGELVGQPLKHDLEVNMTDVSPNGRWVVTASADRTARVWSTATGQPVIEPIKFKDSVKAARFSGDGHRIVIGSEDATAQVWTCLSGQPKSEPFSHGDQNLYFATFSSNAKLVATCGHDRQVRIWNVGTGEQVTEPMVQGERPTFAEFSLDDRRLLVVSVGTSRSYIQVWDAKTGAPVGARIGSPVGRIANAEFSADGASILVVGRTGATVLATETGEPRFEARIQHRDARSARAILSGRFNADSTRFVTTGQDKAARIWDAKTGAAVGKPFMHEGDVTDAVFSRDGSFLATGSKDRTARFWEIASGKAMTDPMLHDRGVNTVDLNPDASVLITACEDSTVRVWRTETGQSGAEPLQHSASVTSARFSEDGLLVVSWGSRERSASVWETASWKLVTAPLAHGEAVNSAVFSKDASFVATASNDDTARVWQISIPGEAPTWLTDLAVTVGGFKMVESGGGTELVLDPWEKISDIRKAIKSEDTDEDYAKWGEWFLADRSGRKVSSYATLGVPEYVSQKVADAEPQSLEEALDLQPENALALARLGVAVRDEALADFYTGLAVDYEPENHDALWSRGAVLQRQQKFSDAWPFLDRASKLDPWGVDSFGPEGADFKSPNLGGGVSQGWLPVGWRDNNSATKYTVQYTKLADGPPGTDAAVGVKATGGAGRAELVGTRFAARAGANRVIEFWARGPKGRSISVYARGFIGRRGERLPTYASEIVRIDDQWKQYSVLVRSQQDLAAEVVFQIPTSAAGQAIDIADVVVRTR